MTIPLGLGPPNVGEAGVFHPFMERHFDCFDAEVTLRTIEAGKELFTNYLFFGGVGDFEEWEENLADTKNLCSTGLGQVSEYEDQA